MKHCDIKWLIASVLVCLGTIGLAFVGSETASVMAERTESIEKTTIVIDAGHGGEDGGAISASGIPESQYNLAISLRLEKMLQLLGLDTIMVRTSDRSVYSSGTTLAEKKRSDLKERVALTERTKNSILVSIHQNMFQDPRYYGAQVFYANTEGSQILAEALQDALVKNVDTANRHSARQAKGIYLMEHIHRPGILVECGFLSNEKEEAKLRDTAYQKKLSGIIAVTIQEQAKNIINPNT